MTHATPDRNARIESFLAQAGWAQARRRPLAGDASNRRYERLHLAHRSAVLMDAPPDRGEDVRPFTRIARHLQGLALSAPQILAEDAQNGLLLLEDLGDDLFARLTEAAPTQEPPLYQAATDLLVTLHQAPPPAGLDRFTPEVMVEQVRPVWDWYLGQGNENPRLQAQFSTLFLPILAEFGDDQSVMILRDFHAENLIWLPDRSGVASVGLLDFQDAKAGSIAYDLVSLLQDARRDVSAATEAAMIQRYIDRSGCDDAAFRIAYALMGAQRNLRILGVLTRLGLQAGKPRYLAFLPRVWDHLKRDLDHPLLRPVRDLVAETLSPPDPDQLNRLKMLCPTP